MKTRKNRRILNSATALVMALALMVMMPSIAYASPYEIGAWTEGVITLEPAPLSSDTNNNEGWWGREYTVSVGTVLTFNFPWEDPAWMVVYPAGGDRQSDRLTGVVSDEGRIIQYILDVPGTFHICPGHSPAIIIHVVGDVPSIDTQPPQTITEQPSSWAVEQVNAAIAAGLVPQNLQSNFTQATTRAEFAALAVALYENQMGEIIGRNTFADTSDVNVQKAAYIGIVSGVGNNMFAPNDTLTREQAAVMLSRLAYAIGHPLPSQAATFADNANISAWAIEGVGQVQAAGIMSGVGDNRFAPQNLYTREQSIVTIMRLLDLVQ